MDKQTLLLYVFYFVVFFGPLIFGLLLAYLPNKQNQKTNQKTNFKSVVIFFIIINLILVCVLFIGRLDAKGLNIIKLPVIEYDTTQEILKFFTIKPMNLDISEVKALHVYLSFFQTLLLIICIVDLFIKNHKENYSSRKVYGLYFIVLYFCMLQWQTLMNEGGIFVTYLSDTFKLHNIIIETIQILLQK